MESSPVIWSLLSYFLIGLAYFAATVFVAGLLSKLIGYLRTPMPWPETTTPAPTTEGGAVLRVLGDVTIFPNLFKADKWLWAGAWLFHAGLAAVLFRHMRYFTYPVPGLVLAMEPAALFFGYLLGGAALFLFFRRLVLPRTLYISNIPDFFALALLGGIAATGILMSTWIKVYLVDVKAFMLGLITLNPVLPPQHPLFLFHFFLVLLLLIYFPFSKLLHAGGIFFSPSRNLPFEVQVAGKRHVNPWDKPAR
ncbi:MAG TPA: respiratory nitrate reductase subunit gamma [Anaerolineales bacterium]|nr:respiratory nitrate reductase subunit gamma [Anaerolineales bacterium]